MGWIARLRRDILADGLIVTLPALRVRRANRGLFRGPPAPLPPPTVPLDLAATLAPLRHGTTDPTIRFFGRTEVLRATLSPEGPTTEHLRHLGDEVEVEAWGPGADWALEHAPDLIGEAA